MSQTDCLEHLFVHRTKPAVYFTLTCMAHLIELSREIFVLVPASNINLVDIKKDLLKTEASK